MIMYIAISEYCLKILQSLFSTNPKRNQKVEPRCPAFERRAKEWLAYHTQLVVHEDPDIEIGRDDFGWLFRAKDSKLL